jgi:energy-coupling factor transporter ATP-binding protein EcfA2
MLEAKDYIALIGAPGSGKTTLAHAVRDAIVRDDGTCEECFTPVEIIDKYAEWVSHHGDYAVGYDGGYMTNIAISTERYNRERRALQRAKTVITCGTVLESAIYLALNFEARAQYREGLSQDDQLQEARRIESTLKMMACIYMDTFKYRKVFYLPPNGGDDRTRLFDRNLQASFQAFNAPVTSLAMEGNPDELLAKRVELIMNSKEEQNARQLEGAGASASSPE